MHHESIRSTFVLLSVAFVLLAGAEHAAASLLDFETTPAGATPTDDQPLTTPYSINGGTVRIFFDANHNGAFDAGIDMYPLFEKVGGADGTPGFGSTFNSVPDTARPGFEAQLGQFFLRPPVNTAAPGPLVARYDTTVPIRELSGEIWDIDGIDRLGTEQWLVEVLSASGATLASQLSPLGISDQPTSLDSLPWVFSFKGLPDGVDALRLTFTGTKTQGLGVVFNNFSPTVAVPEPSSALLATAGCLALLIIYRRRSTSFGISH